MMSVCAMEFYPKNSLGGGQIKLIERDTLQLYFGDHYSKIYKFSVPGSMVDYCRLLQLGQVNGTLNDNDKFYRQ